MADPTVLISGAGVAGPTLAYWLARHGYRPTVVERATGMRSSGSPVDVRGPAVEVAERMGLMPRLRAAGTRVEGMSFVNARGRRIGHVNSLALRRAAASREVELPRSDLAAILYEAGRDDAEYLFHDSISGLSQDQHGVDVTFERAVPRRFDLVIGADGLHSVVRGLAFGVDPDSVRHMGVYVATLPLHGAMEFGRDVVMYNTPGRLVAVHPSVGGGIAAFIFRSPAVPDFDYRDLAQHKRLVAAAYGGLSWRVPRLLDLVRTADDLFFDSVSAVRLPSWSRGRIAVVGDAASCVSLFGDGSTLAMTGGFTLAEALGAALAEGRDGHAEAFRRYEAAHRKLVEPKQRNVALAASLLVPATRPGIVARNLATRLWPLAAAVAWAGRRRRPQPAPREGIESAA
jgi:2-polyprenyl-6-methoxyphenol hydroxylase-like FAD-dependent oxidoreductase